MHIVTVHHNFPHFMIELACAHESEKVYELGVMAMIILAYTMEKTSTRTLYLKFHDHHQ